MSHRNPSGDLAVVVERALDLLLADLEKERLGTTARPQKGRPAKPGHITRAVRRQVFARDGEQCVFVDELGRRCPARAFLELDHVHARALGGTGEVANIRVTCRAHNRLLAERTFGRAHVERHIRLRQRKSPAPASRCDDEVNAAFDHALATRALTSMGFREPDARRALGMVQSRVESLPASELPIEHVLREALAFLS